MPTKLKTLVIGLDGASLNFTRPWIEQGLLPNFRALMERGSSGELESCLPPVTMPAWRVYSTSKYPGNLGVFWHQQINMQTRTVYTPNASMVTAADYWDYLNRAGIRSGVVGMPDLYPPRPVDGFVVCGGPSSGENYTFPAELAGQLEKEVQYELGMKGDFYGATAESPIVDEALAVIEKTFAGAEYLWRRDPVEFLQIAIFDINRIQHFFYDETPTLRAWQTADRWLGKLAPEFDYVFIMSDHGTERVERAFFLNVWLRQQGYIATRWKPMDVLPRLGINRTTVGRILRFLGLTRFLGFEAIRKYSHLLPSQTGVFGEFGNQAVLDRMDWSRTRAIALAQGPIYINRELARDERAYETLRDELIEKLEAMTEPASGHKVFRKVYRREEIYAGPYIETAPDLLALNYDEFHNRAGLSQPDVFADTWQWKGNNRLKGLFMAAGPGIRAGFAAEGVRIVDLAPTILHANGVPVAEDMDGVVLQQIFEPGSELAQREVTFQPGLDFDRMGTTGEDFNDVVSERLKDLGYIE